MHVTIAPKGLRSHLNAGYCGWHGVARELHVCPAYYPVAAGGAFNCGGSAVTLPVTMNLNIPIDRDAVIDGVAIIMVLPYTGLVWMAFLNSFRFVANARSRIKWLRRLTDILC